MNEYDFKTLNDREFEQLSRDLIQRDTGLIFESFKPGIDGGVDLRHASQDQKKKIIVQSKHWPRATFSKLLGELKKKELPKIKRLKPTRYILTTSLELNPLQKDTILKSLKPFITSTGDILGKDDLNGRLVAHKDIETDHPKLWLSSANVMQRILKNAINGRSEFEEKKIKREISLYVANRKYADALEILNTERFLLILGEPGVGKTTLSKMLIFHHLGKRYKLVKINERVTEGEDAWIEGEKQIFYFNDFLGANISEILQQRNSDTALIDFIERVKSDKNKRLILNSRTSILSKAKAIYANYQHPSINLAKHEISIGHYSKLDRAQILYNHLYFLKSDARFLDQVRKNRFYKAIINHQNFNPRLIEFITDPIRTKNLKPTEYVEFINDKLDNPADIWRDPYLNQTNDEEKFLLHTLFSLGDQVSHKKLLETFTARIQFEVANNGYRNRPDIFRETIKSLEDGFVVSERTKDGELQYRFFNPSITDFLLHYIPESPDIIWRILESSVYTSQFTKRFAYSSKAVFFKVKQDQKKLLSLLKRKVPELKQDESGCQYMDLLDFAYHVADSELVDEICPVLLKNIDLTKASSEQGSYFLNTIGNLDSYEHSRTVIKKRWKDFVDFIFSAVLTPEEFEQTHGLFAYFDESYIAYLNNPDSSSIVSESITKYWQKVYDDIEYSYDSDVSGILNEDELADFIEDKISGGEALNRKLGFKYLPALDKLRDIDIPSVVESNKENIYGEDFMADMYKDDYYAARSDEKEMDRAIDELFR